jgi:hypothetical protein
MCLPTWAARGGNLPGMPQAWIGLTLAFVSALGTEVTTAANQR